MRPIAFILPLLAIAGCAVGPNLQTRMAAYTGATSQTLVQSLGVPDKQITVNGVEYLAYERHRTEISPGLLPFGGFGPFYGGYGGYGGGFYGGSFYDAGIPPQVNDLTCETTFLLKGDHVFNFTLRGNDCS